MHDKDSFPLPRAAKTGSAPPRGKPFPPGNTQGRGRPRGSRNRTTLLFQELLSEWGPSLLRKTLKLALEGDPTAWKLTVERLLPRAQDDRIALRLPPVRSADDLPPLAHTVLRALSRGQISLPQATAVFDMIAKYPRPRQLQALERRLELLEQTTAPASGLDPLSPPEEPGDGHL